MEKPKIIDKKTFQRFSQLLVQLKTKPQNILIIHDVDGDGISSGKILKEGLAALGIRAKYRFAAYDRTNLFGDFMVEFVQKRHLSVIFTTDLNLLATNYFAQKQLLKDKIIVVFDHHEAPTELDSNIIYFHPQLTFGFKDASQYCTSKLVYDLMEEFTDLSTLKWVASIGLVSDSNYRTWGEFVDGTLQELNLPVPKNPFDSQLQEVGTLLYYGLALDRQVADKAIKTFFNANSYQEAMAGLEEYRVVEEEINYFIKNWKKFADEKNDVVFITIKPKYKINSLLSNKISPDYPTKTIIVASEGKAEEGKEPEFMAMSLRRQDGKLNLPALLKEIAKQLPGTVGGGHIPASGAKCRKEDYEQFKELFRKLQDRHRIK